jgi:hypothetical protein
MGKISFAPSDTKYFFYCANIHETHSPNYTWLKSPYPKFHKNRPENIKKTEQIFIYARKETVVTVAETIITKSTLA